MPKTNDFCEDILEYACNGVAPAWAGAGQLFVGWYESAPTTGGSQTDGETAYAGYARVAIDRTPGAKKWTLNKPTRTIVTAIDLFWPFSSSGPHTLKYCGVGTGATGAGRLLFYFSPQADLIINNLGRPELLAGAYSYSEA
jgi:hypothetical protein